MLADQLLELRLRLLAGTLGIDENRTRLGNTDGIGELHLADIRQPGGDDVLGDIARHVGGAAIYLAGILAAEGTATVAAAATVGVDDDLAAGKARIRCGTSLDEFSGRVDMEDGLVIEEFPGHHLPDQFIDDLRLDVLLQVGLGSVLGRDDHRVHPGGNTILIFDGDL